MTRSSKPNKRKARRAKSNTSRCRPSSAAAARVAKLTSSVADEQQRQQIVALFEELAAERDAAAAERDAAAAEREAEAAKRSKLAKTNDELTALTDKLRRQVQHLSRMLYGRRSEKLSPEDLGQLALAFGGSEAESGAGEPDVPAPDPPLEDQQAEQDEAAASTKKKKRRKHPGRTRLSPELERKITEVPVPEDERTCQCCGTEMSVIGHLEHEQVEYVPAKLVVHVERRQKLGCKACRGDAVTAERADPPAVQRRAGASLLAHLIESKCDDALPIHRQRDQLSRLGFEVPANTLYEYWSYVTDLLWPLAETTLSVVLGDPHYVAIDDTSLRVLDRRKNKGSYRGHLWCFTGSGPLVAYAFTETWKAQQLVPWIAAIDGFIQCDDYKGYSSTVHWPDGTKRVLVPPERRLGCMMHVRRRFYAAFKQPDQRATEPIRLIRSLYKTEEEAKSLGLDADARTELRAEQSLPVLTDLEKWVDAHQSQVLPSSRLGRAIAYAKQQRPYIRRCFEDGRFEIDNGFTERQIREPAIGRKNFLFTGSADGAKRLAGAYTLVQSCRNLGVPTRAYLLDVIHKLEAGWRLRRIRELVPDRWAELHRSPSVDQLPQ